MVKSLCERIKELREDHDLTQFQVAEILGCAKYTYQRYEYGELLLPTDKLEILADYYQTSTDYILGRTNVAHPYPPARSTSRFHRVSPIHSSIILPNVIIFDKKTKISQYILCFPPVFVSKCVWAAVAALQNPPVCFISMYGCGQIKKTGPLLWGRFCIEAMPYAWFFLRYSTVPPTPAAAKTSSAVHSTGWLKSPVFTPLAPLGLANTGIASVLSTLPHTVQA